MQTPSLAILRSLLLLSLSTNALAAADLGGEWDFSVRDLNDTNQARLVLKSDGEKLSGTLTGLSFEGTLNGDNITLGAKRPDGERFADLTGKVAGNAISGTGTWRGDHQVTWSAKRPATPPATPQAHTFEPTEFHRVFSDAIPPALRIFPGDTVRTWTVDAGGVDSKGVTRSLGGNPQTGPFYVEGGGAGTGGAGTGRGRDGGRDGAGAGTGSAGAGTGSGPGRGHVLTIDRRRAGTGSCVDY